MQGILMNANPYKHLDHTILSERRQLGHAREDDDANSQASKMGERAIGIDGVRMSR